MRNRNWIVGSSINLREALAYIIQKNPQYVLITSDHPNKKVRVLPKMLMQAFPVRVIGFAEKGTSTSTKNLHEMTLEYNLYPPVSGPAIERMILKIRKDEELKQQNENLVRTGKLGDAANGGHELITFKGETASADALKASFDQARAALSQLVNSDGGGIDNDGAAHIPGSNSSPTTSFQQPGSGHDPLSPAYRGSAMGGTGGSAGDQGRGHSADSGFGYGSTTGGFGKSSRVGADENSESNSGGRFGATRSSQRSAGENEESDSTGRRDLRSSAPHSREGQYGSRDSFPQGANAEGEGGHGDESRGIGVGRGADGSPSPAGNPDSNQASAAAGKPVAQESAGDAKSAESAETTSPAGGRGRSKKEGAPIMESEYVPKATPKPYRMVQEKDPKNPDEKTSIFVQGTYQSLQQTANRKGQERAEEISQSSNVACIQVESPRFSGYLVCAMGRDRKIDKTFIDIIKQRLLRFLKESGEELKDKDTLNLKIQPVNFTAWALEQADFLKKSVHDGDEIAIAFFPTQIQNADLQSSVSEKMVMIHMNELKDDTPVEFDLYIFMPENNKYLLYTPQGRPFYGKQKDRLKDKGITHMHLRKEAAPNVQKYRAQNFLNDKISAYRSGKKASG